ncbi:alpha/beta fold hydrolase [Erythrobacter rubeus]|uniref:Alpha/beta fold hydrolase n=1 Tax=Erythrobacter rubeus TaxID=2760803 RepID=A0ABR8KMH0_9SPHN|nr:alpha/beta fold hydrolase [Erythrobacter rubeus]MBD2841731.1 alpha/beta fold hydrolase [Erythrobacter rubeus]
MTASIPSRLAAALAALCALIALHSQAAAEDWIALADEHMIELEDFTFDTGETLPSITMHALTLGTPRRNEDGEIENAVMLLHGTGGQASSLLRPRFGDAMFGPGQPLDISRFYIISPSNLGHGKSSKPSDGLRAAFPRYDYDDMVRAQYRMLNEGFDVEGLEMVLGTSMGCMHSFVWGPTYPGFVDKYVALACNAVEIAGRNRLMRQMVIDGYRSDPAYDGGDYADPADLIVGQAIRRDILLMAGSNPYRQAAELPTRASVEQYYAAARDSFAANPVDPNDTIYQFDASRDYNPAARLHEITSPVLWINSADDFINPPSLGNPAALASTMPNARFVLIPPSAETYGHGTHSRPNLWMDELQQFLEANP